MKHIIAGGILLLCTLASHAAGFQSLEIPGPAGKPISLAIWYPSAAPTQARNLGTFSQDVASDGAVDGTGLPLVIVSHGTGGSKYDHHDTALDLADAGFVVVALTHPAHNYADNSAAADILAPQQHIVMVLDFMLKEWRDRERIAPSRIGMFGFSSGGFTTLVSIGGQPDLRKVLPFCAEHPAQFTCAVIARRGESAARPTTTATAAMHEHRIRAAVVVAPALGFTFDAAALANVTIPVQLWRGEADTILPNPWYAEHVRATLPRQPEYHVVPLAGHLDFSAPCSAMLAARAPQLCASQQGFDRIDFHRRFNADVIRFLKTNLPVAGTGAGVVVGAAAGEPVE